jgi:hypothetical protein
MPTSNELRVQAKDCLELARNATDYYAKVALKELAQTRPANRPSAADRIGNLAQYPPQSAQCSPY